LWERHPSWKRTTTPRRTRLGRSKSSVVAQFDVHKRTIISDIEQSPL
jgi:hypothetical protein